jgi:secondary thiamine-phosphate synthase enzyme
MIELEISTDRKVQALDVTDLVANRDWPNGLLWVACPHTTAALVLGESDPEMLADYERIAAQLFVPFEPFRHQRNDNPNAAAHLVSSLAGTQLILPVREGRPVLGQYQRIIFIELDGPRQRRLQLTTIAAGPEPEWAAG